MYLFFFLNDTATTEIYTLSLHDALPISGIAVLIRPGGDIDLLGALICLLAPISWAIGSLYARGAIAPGSLLLGSGMQDRKSTRLNSSHANISYAVFCLKKKKCRHHICRH